MNLPKIPIPLNLNLEAGSQRINHIYRYEDGQLPICDPRLVRISRAFWREDKIYAVHALDDGKFSWERIEG